MSYHAGLDVSLNSTSICIVDQEGSIFREGKTGTDPGEICRFLEACDVPLQRVGLQNEYGKCPEHRQASSNH